jgi:hypothetical protein
MDNEMSGMLSQNVFVMEHLPDGATVIPGSWVYSYKCGPDGGIKSYKARYVAKGFNQQFGIDFTETYAPTGRMPSLRALMAFANHYNMDILQTSNHGDGAAMVRTGDQSGALPDVARGK